MFVVALALVAAIWEFYKAVGPPKGGSVFGWKILPRSNDQVMPHISDMIGRLGDPVQRGADEKIYAVVLKAVWYSLRLAFVGFGLGLLFGLGWAVLMTRFKLVERAVLPYLIISQTVPLIALAPLVVAWGGKLEIGGFQWQKWMSAAILGAFLSFFPIAVGSLRGLTSPPPAALELMNSLAAPWRKTLFKLRFPAAVPYLIPAFKLGASAAVVGVVVAEISAGLRGGIGRLIIEYARQFTADPAKVYTALFGAALLGLLMTAVVGLMEMLLMRNRPRGAT